MPAENLCHSVERLLRTMQTLRSPQGCPWDAEQTPQSLTSYILEEACELIDAIERGSEEMIRDELGDLLLQVVFQAQIFAERKQFDFADVADAINAKLIRRHPHVFGEGERGLSNRDLDRQWEQIKQAEQSTVPTCLSDHLPTRLPALQRAQKLVRKLQKTDLDGAATVPTARAAAAPAGVLTDAEGELGRELFRLVQYAEETGLDAERALRRIVTEMTETVR